MPDPELGQGAGLKAAKLNGISHCAFEKQLDVSENKS